jgi:hypothetical protein
LFVEHGGFYRGGCYTCAWLGPYRQRRALAQLDAQQHVEHVARFPNPDVGKHG